MLVTIDNQIYDLNPNDVRSLDEAVGHCCGTCNDDTLLNLRMVILEIKSRYTPMAAPEYETPSFPHDYRLFNCKEQENGNCKCESKCRHGKEEVLPF